MVSYVEHMKNRKNAAAGKPATSGKPAATGKPSAASGKPAKVNTDVSSEESELADESKAKAPAKRGPGRPPGAKNKTKPEAPAASGKPAGKPITGKPAKPAVEEPAEDSGIEAELQRLAGEIGELGAAIREELTALADRLSALESAGATAPTGKPGKAKPIVKENAPSSLEDRVAMYLSDFIDDEGELVITPEQVMDLEATELATLAEAMEVDISAHKTLAKKRAALSELVATASEGEEDGEDGEETTEVQEVTLEQLQDKKWWTKQIAAGAQPVVQVGDEQSYMTFVAVESDSDGDKYVRFRDETSGDDVTVYETGENPTNPQGISLLGIVVG